MVSRLRWVAVVLVGSLFGASVASAGLNAPLVVNPQDSEKTPVLIYYANATAPHPDYDRVVRWVRNAGEPRFLEVADRLEEDLDKFGSSVRHEIATIKRRIPSLGERRLGVAIFETSGARSGRFEYVLPADAEWRSGELKLPDFDRVAFERYPLCHPEVFGQALERVAQLFNPKDHEFILVTKSHGSEQFALTTLFNSKINAGSAEQLLVQLRDHRAGVLARKDRPQDHSSRDPQLGLRNDLGKSSDLGAENDLGNTDDLGAENDLGRQDDLGLEDDLGRENDLGQENDLSQTSDLGRTNDLGRNDDLAALNPEIGVTKDCFLTRLQQLGADRQMRFPIVLLYSCKSQLDDSQVRRIPSNIGLLYAADEAIDYRAVNFDSVFDVAAAMPFTYAMDIVLRQLVMNSSRDASPQSTGAKE